jgi:bacterioferritin
MTNDTVIEELNTLLRGTYMGIRSLEHYIQKVDDDDIKKIFQSMQKDTKLDAQKLAERIQNLGGVPADDEGFSGSMHSFMHKVMLSDDVNALLDDAIHGMEQYGVQYAEELVKGDLDPISQQLAEQVIDTNRRNAEILRHHLS